MKHLLVFDMDETFLLPDKTVSADNLMALEKLQSLNILYTIASGRSPFMIGRYIDELSVSMPVISCNGGLISGADLKTVIWENPIRKDLVKNVLAYLAKSDSTADILAYTSSKVFYSMNSTRLAAFRQYNTTVLEHRKVPLFPLTPDVMLGEEEAFIKILLYCPTAKQEAYLRSMKGLEVVSSGVNFLDIMQKGSTKGNAVLALAKHLDIPIENVAVFGDNENDISMFRCGALSVAMGNSQDFVKAEAQYVTTTNTLSGVAKVIEKYVLPMFGYTD